MAGAFATETWNEGFTETARSRKSRTLSYWESDSGEGRWRESRWRASGRLSEGTR
jgi:hypothetical protein